MIDINAIEDSKVNPQIINDNISKAREDIGAIKKNIGLLKGVFTVLNSELSDVEKYNGKYVKVPDEKKDSKGNVTSEGFDYQVSFMGLAGIKKDIENSSRYLQYLDENLQGVEKVYDEMAGYVDDIKKEIEDTADDASDGIDSYDTGSGNNAFGGGSSSSSPGMGNTGSSGYDNAGGSWNGSGEDGYFEDDGSYGDESDMYGEDMSGGGMSGGGMSGGGMSGGGMSGDDYSSGMTQQSTYTPVDYEKYDPSKYNTSLSTSASNAAKSIVPTAVGAGVAGAVSDLASSVKDKDSYSTTSKYNSDDEYKKNDEDNKSNKNSNSDSYSASRYGAGSYGGYSGYSGSSNDVVNAVEAASNNVLPDPINPIAPNTEYAAIPNTGATQPIIHTYKKNKAGTTLTAALFGLGAAGGIVAKKVKDNKEKNENTENEEENYDDVVQSYDNLEDEII